VPKALHSKVIGLVHKPRNALRGAFTILINLYQNCFATFSYVRLALRLSIVTEPVEVREDIAYEAIASKGHCAAGIAPEGYCWRSHCVQRILRRSHCTQRVLRPKDIAGEAIAPQALRPKDIATETPSYLPYR
jgi:hypothetical protein